MRECAALTSPLSFFIGRIKTYDGEVVLGDTLNVGISLAAAVPLAGDAVTIGKYTYKGVKAAKEVETVVSDVGKLGKNGLRETPLKLEHPVAGDNVGVYLRPKGTGKYQVGAYKDIKGVEGLDAHHAGQKVVMKKLVDNYDPNTAPAINVPKVGHTIKGPGGIVSRSTKGIDNPRQLLARDIMELRRVYDDIPNSSLKELIELNKKMYPEMRK